MLLHFSSCVAHFLLLFCCNSNTTFSFYNLQSCFCVTRRTCQPTHITYATADSCLIQSHLSWLRFMWRSMRCCWVKKWDDFEKERKTGNVGEEEEGRYTQHILLCFFSPPPLAFFFFFFLPSSIQHSNNLHEFHPLMKSIWVLHMDN